MTAVPKLIKKYGTARQALLHMSERQLENMDDDQVDALFEAAGLGHLFNYQAKPVRKRKRANSDRPKTQEPGRTI